ncbi:MAG TPA: hypothetical protein VHQ42_05285 [Candidatus Limnocylindria bacterium]|nr:hypothetical protein [Candidatus Limnocylindria bacterium]
MTHAQPADVRTGMASPAIAAVLVAIIAVVAALALTQPLPAFRIDLGAAEAERNDAALIEAGRTWEAEYKQRMAGGGVSDSVLDSARAWEERYHQLTPAATTDISGELHSEYLIELFARDGGGPLTPAATTDISGELHSEYLIDLFAGDEEPTRFGPPGR